jgi:hypothetical protein
MLFLFTLLQPATANTESLDNLFKLEGRGMGISAMNEDYLREIIINLLDYDYKPEMKPAAVNKICCGEAACACVIL